MAVAGFVIMHLIQTAGPSEGHAKPQVTWAAGRVKTRPRPVAAASRVRLGIISDNLLLFEQQTKIRPVLSATYMDWGVPFPAAKVSANHALGATTLIVLEPRNLSPQRIAAGRDNAYLASFATAERKLGLPIILS